MYYDNWSYSDYKKLEGFAAGLDNYPALTVGAAANVTVNVHKAVVLYDSVMLFDATVEVLSAISATVTQPAALFSVIYDGKSVASMTYVGARVFIAGAWATRGYFVDNAGNICTINSSTSGYTAEMSALLFFR